MNLPPVDVPPAFQRSIDHGSWRGEPSDHDVICFVKRHICDKELSQDPILVLTYARASGFPLVPNSKSFANQFRENVLGKGF